MSATTERNEVGWVLRQPGMPVLVAKDRAVLPRGCAVFVGLRTDTLEAASAALRCGEDHATLIKRFDLLLRESLVAPSSRPLIDVVAELLAQAEAIPA